MHHLAIVTDSSACLPQSLLDEYQIVTVPLSVVIDGETFCDGALPGCEFYSRLEASRVAASTSAPSPGEFIAAFRRALGSGNNPVLCLTMSSAFSATHASAVKAQAITEKEIPGACVRVVDTGGVAMTHGFAVLAAAVAGSTLDEAVEAALNVSGNAHLAGVLGTTLYLAKGARIPWIAHWAASLLRIKPVLSVVQGKARAIGRARTMDAAVDKIINYARRRITAGGLVHVAVMHAEAPERALQLAALVRGRLAPIELIVTEFTHAMGVHTGPGFVGLAFYSEQPAATAGL